jgi:DNA-3-methyladenine glycosylase
MKIPFSYYQSTDVVHLARNLIGKRIFSRTDGKLTGGIISETEAYAGVNDRASHAFGTRRTDRTKIMYEAGGVSYIYLCYGIHYLFNIVTGPKDIPHAVLIRGIIPETGLDEIRKRRHFVKENQLANGPGKVSSCLGINLSHNGMALNGDIIWLEKSSMDNTDEFIIQGKRIGIDYAGQDAELPYRFLLDIKKAPHLFETLL